MPLSRAEIQKNYRERKKEKNRERYLAKERKRQRKNYIPVELLTSSARKKRNERTKERVKKQRDKRKAAENVVEQSDDPDSSGYESHVSSTPGEQMVVRLPFVVTSARRKGPRKRTSRALSRATRVIKTLEQENERLRKKVKTTQKRAQRLKTKVKGPLTPRRKTDQMMKLAGMKKGQGKNVRKQLLLSNILFNEIKNNMETKNRKYKKMIYGAVAGKLVSKYRCVSKLSDSASLNRNTISNVIKNGVDFAKIRRKRVLDKYKDSVIEFLERQDNCRVKPGKNDATKCEDGKTQTRVLTDYIDNLYHKYCSENPNATLSLTTFSRIRPKYILPTSFLSRDTCLCTKHQNFAFKLKSMKSIGFAITTNPDELVKQGCEIEEDKLPDKVTFSLWKRVTVKDGKKKMKIVKEEVSKNDFYPLWKKELSEFREHVRLIQVQYAQIRELKRRLPANEAIIHMDFAENYSCKTAEEIQSAYWNQSQVTLHPMVVYVQDPETKTLKHRSLVAVSDTMTHASASVLAILDKFFALNIPEMTNINRVHYWTDSPTSQYRNRFIFDAIISHEQQYGCSATWNYFEAGHGKGPCDGVGGTVKRLADTAVNCQKATIQDADDFFAWASDSNVKSVDFFFVTKEECANKAEEVKKCTLLPVKGTMTLHACTSDNNLLLTAKTSCYCDDCIRGKWCENFSIVAAARSRNSTHSDIGGTGNACEQGSSGITSVSVVSDQDPPSTSSASVDCSTSVSISASSHNSAHSINTVGTNNVSTRASVDASVDPDAGLSVSANKNSCALDFRNRSVNTGPDVLASITAPTSPAFPSVSVEVNPEHEGESSANVSYATGDYVAAIYDAKWYIGKIRDTDKDDVEISFMQKRRNLFQWPQPEDIIWVDYANVLCRVKELTASGKSKRMYKLDPNDWEVVERNYMAR